MSRKCRNKRDSQFHFYAETTNFSELSTSIQISILIAEMEKMRVAEKMANLDLSSEGEDLEKATRLRVKGNELYKSGKLNKGLSLHGCSQFMVHRADLSKQSRLTWRLLPPLRGILFRYRISQQHISRWASIGDVSVCPSRPLRRQLMMSP